MNIESCKLFLESDRKTDAIKAKFQQERRRLRAKLAQPHAAKTPPKDSSRTRTPSWLSQRQLKFQNAWTLLFSGRICPQSKTAVFSMYACSSARKWRKKLCAVEMRNGFHLNHLKCSATVTIFLSQRANVSITPRPDWIFINGATLLKVPVGQKPLQPT